MIIEHGFLSGTGSPTYFVWHTFSLYETEYVLHVFHHNLYTLISELNILPQKLSTKLKDIFHSFTFLF